MRVLKCIEALAEHVACLKRLKTSAFGSSEPLLLLRLNGRVGAIPTYRVYRLYDMFMSWFYTSPVNATLRALYYITYQNHSIIILIGLSPPSDVAVSQNGAGSVEVSWTPPSGEPNVTGYIIYYQGGHAGSKMAGATATTTTITGLITGATYSIAMVATSSTLPSTVTAAENITIGMI